MPIDKISAPAVTNHAVGKEFNDMVHSYAAQMTKCFIGKQVNPVAVEIAAINVYATISHGVRAWAQAEQQKRLSLFVQQASQQLAKLVMDISAMPYEDVEIAVSTQSTS